MIWICDQISRENSNFYWELFFRVVGARFSVVINAEGKTIMCAVRASPFLRGNIAA